MKAEIIAVGSELLTPHHLDTNSLFLTERLNNAGFEVHLKTIVGDVEEDIARVLHGALERSQVIICCGGLGPTEDDLTRTAVAGVLRRTLSIDQAILEALRRRFASRGYAMPKINERQAQVIDRAEILANPFGTAPGMWIEQDGTCIALLPGPPRELEAMFDTAVAPRVKTLGRGRTLAQRVFHITGMTESEVDSRVAPIYRTYPSIRTTILASTGHIAIHLYRWLEPGEPATDLDNLATGIQQLLGDAIFSTSGEHLEQAVGRLLRESRRTLAVAESCTSGMIGSHLTRVPGSSDYFLGGVLCYSNEVKKLLCGVSDETLRREGAVSPEAAEALAQGVRTGTGSSIGLSVTGIAGPDGGSEEKPVGLVYVGISDQTGTAHWRRIIPGDRESIRERATYFALSLLRRWLLRSC